MESKDEAILLNKLIYYGFMYSSYLMRQMEKAMPKAAYPSINKTDIENFIISVPAIEDQNKALTEIEQLEASITEAQSILNGAAARKQAVIKQHL